MIFTLAYFDRYTEKPIRQDVSPGKDLVTIEVPAQPDLDRKPFRVHVSPDSVTISGDPNVIDNAEPSALPAALTPRQRRIIQLCLCFVASVAVEEMNDALLNDGEQEVTADEIDEIDTVLSNR